MSDWSTYCIVVADEPIDHDQMPSSTNKAKVRAKEMIDEGAERVFIYGVALVAVVEKKPKAEKKDTA